MFVMHADQPEWIRNEEELWSKSFENFTSLLPYNGEPAHAVRDIQLPAFAADAITFAQVSIGRFFDPEGWTMDQVTQATLEQEILRVPTSLSQLRL